MSQCTVGSQRDRFARCSAQHHHAMTAQCLLVSVPQSGSDRGGRLCTDREPEHGVIHTCGNDPVFRRRQAHRGKDTIHVPAGESRVPRQVVGVEELLGLSNDLADRFAYAGGYDIDDGCERCGQLRGDDRIRRALGIAPRSSTREVAQRVAMCPLRSPTEPVLEKSA